MKKPLTSIEQTTEQKALGAWMILHEGAEILSSRAVQPPPSEEAGYTKKDLRDAARDLYMCSQTAGEISAAAMVLARCPATRSGVKILPDPDTIRKAGITGEAEIITIGLLLQIIEQAGYVQKLCLPLVLTDGAFGGLKTMMHTFDMAHELGAVTESACGISPLLPAEERGR